MQTQPVTLWWNFLLNIVKFLTDINWGSSVQSESYRQAMNAVFSLDRFDDHVKTFRPQILLFAGDPSDRPPLVHFAHSLTKNMALLVVANCSDEVRISVNFFF